jgi:excisionase family DNA binding protein
MKKILTPEETAERLKVSAKTIRDWLRQGRLKGIKIGRQWRIEESIITEILVNGLNLDEETKDWLYSSEPLPEYDWGKEGIPEIKPVKYTNGKWQIIDKK